VAVVTFLGLGVTDGAVADPGLLAFFAAGAVAICAMILPGISGAFLLLLLGMYPAVIAAVDERLWGPLAVLALGCLVGLAGFATLLNWLLREHHDAVLAALLGLLLGSSRVLWPWPGDEVGDPRLGAVVASEVLSLGGSGAGGAGRRVAPGGARPPRHARLSRAWVRPRAPPASRDGTPRRSAHRSDADPRAPGAWRSGPRPGPRRRRRRRSSRERRPRVAAGEGSGAACGPARSTLVVGASVSTTPDGIGRVDGPVSSAGSPRRWTWSATSRSRRRAAVTWRPVDRDRVRVAHRGELGHGSGRAVHHGDVQPARARPRGPSHLDARTRSTGTVTSVGRSWAVAALVDRDHAVLELHLGAVARHGVRGPFQSGRLAHAHLRRWHNQASEPRLPVPAGGRPAGPGALSRGRRPASRAVRQRATASRQPATVGTSASRSHPRPPGPKARPGVATIRSRSSASA
jgi:hypothetical protein